MAATCWPRRYVSIALSLRTAGLPRVILQVIALTWKQKTNADAK